MRIDSLQAERTGQNIPTAKLFFDINAKLEEQKKSMDTVELNFNLLITTKPNIVKYSTIGVVTLEGSPADIKKKLEANPKTNIPQILFTVYQHVFNSIYILASILNTPYPPPDLLHPMAERIQILSNKPEASTQPEQTAASKPPSTLGGSTVETAATSSGQPTQGQPSAGQTATPTPRENQQSSTPT